MRILGGNVTALRRSVKPAPDLKSSLAARLGDYFPTYLQWRKFLYT